MSDDELIALFGGIIEAGLVELDITGVTLEQAYASVLIGVTTGAMISFFKVADHRYGIRKSESVWNPEDEKEIRTTEQVYESTFQIQALVPQTPSPDFVMTASDLINTVAQILQDEDAVNTFQQSGVGILRVTDVRNPYFMDDHDQFEACPSFDFTLTHKQITTKEVPVIESPIESGIYPV